MQSEYTLRVTSHHVLIFYPLLNPVIHRGITQYSSTPAHISSTVLALTRVPRPGMVCTTPTVIARGRSSYTQSTNVCVRETLYVVHDILIGRAAVPFIQRIECSTSIKGMSDDTSFDLHRITLPEVCATIAARRRCVVSLARWERWLHSSTLNLQCKAL